MTTAATARSETDEFGSNLYLDSDREIVDRVAEVAGARGVAVDGDRTAGRRQTRREGGLVSQLQFAQDVQRPLAGRQQVADNQGLGRQADGRPVFDQRPQHTALFDAVDHQRAIFTHDRVPLQIGANQQVTNAGASIVYYEHWKATGEQALLDRPISDLNLSVRARKCMVRLGLTTIGELIRKTGDDMLECKNFGVTSLNEVREKLTVHQLKLRGD